jgi:hypothetical protein
VLVPAVLYQGFQIVFGQISVAIIKKWRLRTLAAAAIAEGSIHQDEESRAHPLASNATLKNPAASENTPTKVSEG